MKNITKNIHDWLTGADVSRLGAKAARKSVKRFARGNVSIQQGRYITDKQLVALRAKGESAYSKLKS